MLFCSALSATAVGECQAMKKPSSRWLLVSAGPSRARRPSTTSLPRDTSTNRRDDDSKHHHVHHGPKHVLHLRPVADAHARGPQHHADLCERELKQSQGSQRQLWHAPSRHNGPDDICDDPKIQRIAALRVCGERLSNSEHQRRDRIGADEDSHAPRAAKRPTRDRTVSGMKNVAA